jgi:hypothetical protein
MLRCEMDTGHWNPYLRAVPGALFKLSCWIFYKKHCLGGECQKKSFSKPAVVDFRQEAKIVASSGREDR